MARGRPDTHVSNADLNHSQLATCCRIDREGRLILKRAISRFRLSARGFDRLRRVSKTLADLDEADTVGASHVTEALSYRDPESDT